MLRLACRDRATWLPVELDISVNVAPAALLDAELVEGVATVLAETGTPAAALTLEITETAMTMDVDRARQTLLSLRVFGVTLSLDDYGTGYNSLTYLRDLPLHEVKIDRSFVMTLRPGSPDAKIVSSSVHLARSLGLRVVAEGVETAEALGLLTELGCDAAQGHLLGRPVPADRLVLNAGGSGAASTA